MNQYRLNDTQRRRRIKYDLISAPKKGIGGLKLDRQRFVFLLIIFFYQKSMSRNPEPDTATTNAPVVPSLASSVPSVIANSSTTDQSVVIRSRSDADGGEPSSSPPTTNIIPAPAPLDETNRVAIRQPADGLGNANPTNWRTSNNNSNNEERSDLSWGSDDDDDGVPPSARQRPVIIGGEDNPLYHHSEDEETLLTDLSLNTNN